MIDDQGFDPNMTTTVPDNEFWDGTDGAHPAWWRGQEWGSINVVKVLTKIIETGEHRGGLRGELEILAQKVLLLTKSTIGVKSECISRTCLSDSERIRRHNASL